MAAIPGLPPARFARAAGIGLLVAGVFFAFAHDRIEHAHHGNASGLVHIADWRYDRNPLVNERPDLRSTLVLESTDGYDGQFFYFMAFDPLVARYQHRPRSYTRVVDAPSYRFGRIGFSWLTRLFSGGREVKYPVTMVALVVGALGVCGALLSLIAMQNGASAWCGALILAIPGFWQATVLAMPEPITLACILAGVLLAGGEKWMFAGLALGLAMLIRETSGAIVLAIPAALFLAGRRRESIIVVLLAFVPVVLWKAYVGWVFYSVEGIRAFFPHPDDVGLPFGGIWRFWAEVVGGTSMRSATELRSGVMFSALVVAAAALAATVFWKRPGPMVLAAVFSAALSLTFNYELVWVYIANAQRITIDLFATLAILYAQQGHTRPATRAHRVVWLAAALYVLFGMSESVEIRRALVGWMT